MNDDIFFQALQTRQSLFGNTPEPRFGPDLPLPASMQQGATGMMLGLAWQSMAPQLYQQFGYIPGIFEPQGNITDQFAAREYWQSRQKAVMQATKSDRANMMRTARGLARSAGVQFGQQQQSMLSAGLDWADSMGLTAMAATLAPETFDALGGSRGSAAVMATRIHDAGRFQVDPVTGRIGFSGSTAGGLSNEVYRQLYGDGADITKMYGIGAGRAGELFQAMGQKGLLGRGIGTFDTAGQLEQLQGDNDLVRQGLQTLRTSNQPKFQQLLQQFTAQTGKSAGISPTEQIRNLSTLESGTSAAIQALKDSGNPQFEAALRQFDATKIARQLQSTSKAITAMRDIFGDSGHTNAPMTELIEGLNALTQGGLVSKSPGEAERIVRTSYMAAKDAGIGIQSLMGLTAQAAAEADAMGLSRGFGVEAAQGAIAFGGALGRAGDGQFTAFGMHDRENLMMQDKQLRLQAGKSNLSNLLGATARLNAATEFAKGSDAANLLQAAKDGKGTVNIGGREIPLWQLERKDFVTAMTNSGVSADTAGMVIGDTRSNEEFSRSFNDLVRRQQGAELINTSMARSFANSITQRAAKIGLSTEEAHKASLTTGAAVSETLMNMSAEERTNRKTRNTLMANTVRNQLASQAKLTAAEQQEVDNMKRGGMDEQAARRKVVDKKFTEQEILTSVEAGWGNFEQTAIDRGYGSAQDLLRLNDPVVMKQKAAEDAQRALRVRIDQSLAPLNRVPMFRRLMDQMGEPDDTFMEGVLNVVGGVKAEKVAALLQPLELELQGAQAQGNQRLIEALKTGGTAAEEQINQMAADRQTDLKGMREDFNKAQTEFEQLAAGHTPEMQQKLISGQKTFVDPAEEALLKQLRPQLQAAQKLAALQTAKDRGGIQGLTAGKRTVDQLQALRHVRNQIDKLGPNADPAKMEELVKIQEALMSGGEAAKTEYDKLAARHANPQGLITAEDIQLRRTLEEVVKSGGLEANLQQIGGPGDDKLTSDGLARWSDSEQLAELNAKDKAVTDDERLASRRKADMLREDAIANLSTDKDAFQKLGRRKDREKGDALGELNPNALVATVKESQRKLEARAKSLGYDTTADALFASKDKELQMLSARTNAGLQEVQARMGATAEGREGIKTSEMTQFEAGDKPPTVVEAKPPTAAELVKHEKHSQLAKYFRDAEKGDLVAKTIWSTIPEEEQKAIKAIDAAEQERQKKPPAEKAAAADSKGQTRIVMTGEVKMIGNDRAQLNLQEVPGTAP